MKILPILLALLMLCGCSYTEPDAQYTVTAVGCSQQNGKTKLYIRLTDAGKGEDGAPATFTVTGEGESVEEAFSDTRTRLSKTLSFGHCPFITVSDQVDKKTLGEFLALCQELNVPMRSPIACCKRIDALLKNNSLTTGEEITSLLKENEKYFGFGGHSALFEIRTALLVNEGKFALPLLDVEGDSVSVNGLYYFSDGLAQRHLSIAQSIKYAKQNSVYEGDKE